MASHVRLLIIGQEFTFRESLFNTRLVGSDYKRLLEDFSGKVTSTIDTFRQKNNGTITPAMTSLQHEIEELGHHKSPCEDGLYKIQDNGCWMVLDHTGITGRY